MYLTILRKPLSFPCFFRIVLSLIFLFLNWKVKKKLKWCVVCGSSHLLLFPAKLKCYCFVSHVYSVQLLDSLTECIRVSLASGSMEALAELFNSPERGASINSKLKPLIGQVSVCALICRYCRVFRRHIIASCYAYYFVPLVLTSV
jgi:hypothetical protein